MLGPAVWIVALLTQAGHDVPVSAPPRVLDPRLVFERIATEPEIVTPTGIAVDARGRVLVIESHTHFRPKDYKGPPADRIRVFEDARWRRPLECVGTFFEGTKMTMSLAVARDGTVFVATRVRVYRLEDRDGDGQADGDRRDASSPRRSSGSTRRATILTTACRASRSISRTTSTSAWARTSVPIIG